MKNLETLQKMNNGEMNGKNLVKIVSIKNKTFTLFSFDYI